MATPFWLKREYGHPSLQICSPLLKAGNTNHIVLFEFCDVCLEVIMGTMELYNGQKSLLMKIYKDEIG